MNLPTLDREIEPVENRVPIDLEGQTVNVQ
jgi:hypothetical protein